MRSRTISTLALCAEITLVGVLVTLAQAPTLPLVGEYYPTEYPYPVGEGIVETAALSDDYAYVSVMGESTWVTDLRIVNVANKSAPLEVGRYQPGNRISDLAVVGEYVYAVYGFFDQGIGLQIIDVSDPDAPTRVGAYPLSEDLSAVAVVYPYVYLGSSSALRIVDVSDPTDPLWVNTFSTSYPIQDIAMVGSYAYIAGGIDGLQIINVADPHDPIELGHCDTPGEAVSVAVSGSYAFVADTGEGLRIVDVSIPAAPSEVGYWDTSWAMGIAVAGTHAYISDYYDGLHVLNVADVANPAQAGTYSTRANQVVVSGFHVYLTAVGSGTGMPILWFAPPNSVSIPTSGGTLVSAADSTTYEFASGAFTDTVRVTHTAQLPGGSAPTGVLVGTGHLFEVTAVFSTTGQPATPTTPYTITVQYSDAEVGPAVEETLGLYWWNGSAWSQLGITSTASLADNLVTAQVDHFSLFAVLGKTAPVYLPLVQRGF